jgi:hypothetical protein
LCSGFRPDELDLGSDAHVPEVVLGVVESVMGQGLHREEAAVGPPTGTRPLWLGYQVVALCVGFRRREEFARHGRGVLEVVALGDGRLVLVSVLKQWIVLGQHQGQTLIHDSIDISNVASVFEVGPLVTSRSHTNVPAFEHLNPGDGVLTNELSGCCSIDPGGVEPAIPTWSLEDPRPILVVGDDCHRPKLRAESRDIRVDGFEFVEVDDPSETAMSHSRHCQRRGETACSPERPLSESDLASPSEKERPRPC